MHKKLVVGAGVLLLLVVSYLGSAFIIKYKVDKRMIIPVAELAAANDLESNSVFYNKYGKRALRLEKKGKTRFDFHFESNDPTTATISLRDIDLTLLTPTLPEWVKNHQDLEAVTLAEIGRNRQRVRFERDSTHLSIKGGDGFEVEGITQVDLIRNDLKTGFWEIICYLNEGGEEVVVYRGQFTFPLGHYKKLFEKANQISYWKHWHRLEYWVNPEGAEVELEQLRGVISQKEVEAVSAEETVKLDKVYARTIHSPATDKILDEIELVFRNTRTYKQNRLVISGIKLNSLPKIPTSEYQKGFQMSIGIAPIPYLQSYSALKMNRPQFSPYFTLLLNDENKLINHQKIPVYASILHRDQTSASRLHLYLLSSEKHSAVRHIEIQL